MSAAMNATFHTTFTRPSFMRSSFFRLLLAALALAFATSCLAQTPQFRATSTMNGNGTLSFPTGSIASDWLVMYVISPVTIATPASWTLTAQRNWSSYPYYSYVFTRQRGSDGSVSFTDNIGGAMIAAYQYVSGIGAVGTYVEGGGSTLALSSITPQDAGSRIVGIVSDRDVSSPTPAAGFTSRLSFNTTYYGQNFGDKVFGNTAPTGTVTWNQDASQFPAVGVMLELLPSPIVTPTIAAAFSPVAIDLNGPTALTLTLSSTNTSALTNANLTASLGNINLVSPTIGGTCANVSNSPALTVGSNALNLTIPNLSPGSCTIVLTVTSQTAGIQSLTTSGITTTETPSAGSPSNTATLTVSSVPTAPTIQNAFAPSWMAAGATSTLTFTIANPYGATLTNANFTDALPGMSVASATLGGTCANVSNSPALTVGATSLNLTIPSLPAAGCTVVVSVTSTALGSHASVASGVATQENATAGGGAGTVYLTVNPVDVGFYYVHPDHVGTPRAITRPSDNAVVWKYENTDPFGNSSPNENPSALGNFVYNLRESRQYQDVETGTRYNYFRDCYNPSTGRYCQSDPIGLRGGINTYAYVGNSPLKYVDPTGLTRADIDEALALARKLKPGWSFPDEINTWSQDGKGGMTERPMWGPNKVYVDRKYLECLSEGEAGNLLNTLFHELAHYNQSYGQFTIDKFRERFTGGYSSNAQDEADKMLDVNFQEVSRFIKNRVKCCSKKGTS